MGYNSIADVPALNSLEVVDMTAKWVPPDLDDLISRYSGGESVKSLAESLGVSRNVITRLLRAEGIETRGRSAAMYTRMAQASPEERSRLSAAAHDAVRGMRRTDGELAEAARTREQRMLGNISAAEVHLAEMLRAQGLDVTHQKAIGKYNVDVATGSVAVEVLGGGWHRVKHHGKRLRYLLDQGWDVVYIWVDGVHFPLGPGAAEYVVSHVKFRKSNPTIPRCYRVVRGTGQYLAGGSADGDDIPDVLPNSDRPNVPPAKVPFGLCHCGCGRRTTVPNRGDSRRGSLNGVPRRYLSGHNRSRDPR